ncbi:MAG: alanine--tRNA ligase [Neisseriaceae bacterium]
MSANEIRTKFLKYFKQHNHEVVSSSSLIPNNDPTLLFTNAGMNQFKNVFLGLETRNYIRAVSAQKCVRAGGKHNDLENVGYTARHHTFFEMLGNFSFGDYFKQDAINFAWEFLTTKLGLPKEKLYVTVYHTDDEAYSIWRNKIGLDESRIIRIGDKESGGSDNFWQMGETGPCGPCTEIFYDHGDSVKGGLPGSADEDGDRYVEIWNCVFMQYNRDEKGVLHPLPKPCVDTGMGLERVTAAVYGKHDNYKIDIFTVLMGHAAKLIGSKQDFDNPSLRVIADHIRSISFLIADGVIASNEGRGYVLRRIIRRAIRHGYKLGMRNPFLYKLCYALIDKMGDAYPELILNKEKIKSSILQEEEKFLQTIDKGMELLQSEISKLTDQEFSGDIAFKLYDTYGFPLDLTEDVCREVGIIVDVVGFDKAMLKQKEKAKSSGKFKMDAVLEYSGAATEFIGYTDTSICANVLALFKDNKPVEKLNVGESGIIVLDKTVFYAESGGQCGDTGIIQINGGVNCLFNVTDTQKIRKDVIGHFGNLITGSVAIGEKVDATYDMHKRLATMRNHSVTHLLHKALHEVIGQHAIQKGSLVCSEYTRFDFAHEKALTQAEIERIEQIVNHVIMMNYIVKYESMKYDDALKKGVLALFGEKYDDVVRVINMGDFSVELCGGTHVGRTGDIGVFVITSESAVASGVRRIEAITGENALMTMQKNMAILDSLRENLKAQSNDIILEKISNLQNENRLFNKEISELKTVIATYQADQLLNKTVTLENGVNSLVLEMQNTDNKILLEIMDKLKNKLGSGIITIGCKNDQRVTLMVGVTSDLVSKYKAGNIVSSIATIVGGKGGGRPDLAQAGGSNIAKLPEALNAVNSVILNTVIN